MRKNFIDNIEGIDFYIYRPSLFRPYDNCYEKKDVPDYHKRIVHRLRMVREKLLFNYVVVYMVVEGCTVGHLVVSRGGSRIMESTLDDIVIGPIWVVPSQRNLGFASKGIHAILHHLGFEYKNAYEFIMKDNFSSIKTVEKNGFELSYKGKEAGFFKRIIPCEQGNINVYKFCKE